MRKTASFVILMLLALCLCVAAGAEAADDTFSSAANDFQLVTDVRDPYYIGCENGDWGVLNVFIADYNQLASQHTGIPIFEIEQTGGLTFKWYQNGNGADWATVVRNQAIPKEGTATFHVVCTWDNDRAECTETVKFAYMPGGLPDGLTGLPTQITVKTGDPIDYYSNLSIAPASWTVPQGAWSYIDASAYYAGSYDWADEALTNGSWQNATFVEGYNTYTAGEPGHYRLQVGLWINNVRISQNVDLFITDKDGNIPKEQMRLGVRSNATYYIDTANGATNILTAVIENYDQLRGLHTGIPEFTVKQTGGLSFKWSLDSYENQSIMVLRNEAIQHEGTATFHITCTWDDEIAEYDVTIDFAHLPGGLPTALNGIPKQITVKTGDPIDYCSNLSFSPAGWTVPQGIYGYIECSPLYYGTNQWATDAFIYGWTKSEVTYEYQTLFAGKPGHYTMLLSLWLQNLCVNEEVELIITDENGNVPKESIQLNMGRSTYYIDKAAGEGSVVGFFIQNYDRIASQYTGDPVFTVTQTGGIPFSWYQDSFDPSSCAIMFSGEINEVGKATFHVVCTWDKDQVESDFTIEFARLPNGMPTAINGLPKQITVKTGDPIVYYNNLSFSPAGWSVPQDTWSYLSCVAYYAGSYQMAKDALIRPSWKNDGNLVNGYDQYIAGKPGRYTMEVALWIENLRISEDVELIITDENGNVPKDDIRLNVDARDTYYIDADGGDWGVLNVSIDNYNQLASQYTSDPVFTITQTGGVKFKWHQDSYAANHATIVRNESIQNEGTATFHIVCTWDNDQIEADAVINFAHIPGGVPTGINGLPLQLVVKTGDRITCLSNLSLSPAGWTVPNDAWSYFNAECFTGTGEWAEGVLLDARWYSSQLTNGYLTYTAGQPGHYQMMVQLWVNNLAFSKNVDLIITDADGNYPETTLPTIAASKTLVLPAGTLKVEDEAFCGGEYEAVVCPDGLKSIGSGAFANSTVRVVTIPASVTSIAPDAFQNTWIQGIICDKGSYAAQYALQNGILTKFR